MTRLHARGVALRRMGVRLGSRAMHCPGLGAVVMRLLVLCVIAAQAGPSPAAGSAFGAETGDEARESAAPVRTGRKQSGDDAALPPLPPLPPALGSQVVSDPDVVPK